MTSKRQVPYSFTQADVIRLLAGWPDPNIGGTVCVTPYADGSCAVLHMSDNGTGWGSDATDLRPLADLAAEVLAIRCRAKLIDCDCQEEWS
jgi:hypothetical protein